MDIAACDGLPTDEAVHGLLTAPGSLTGCLREQCGSGFRLRLLGEHHGPLDGAFGGGRQGLLREVLMACGDRPWVYAQTLIPEATLRANRWLADLGEQPLGDALFRRGGVERFEFRCRRVAAPDPLLLRALAGAGLSFSTAPPALWARRRGYTLDGLALLIREVFLPDCGQCPTS